MLRLLGRAVYRVLGWRLEGELPALPKYVIIGAPHTSTIDGALFLAGIADFGVRLRFISKDSNLRGLLGPLFRRFGAIGIDRARANNLVETLSEHFAANDQFILALGPEGTRGYRPFWKSGFYHIARAADVPVVPIKIDAATRRVVVGPPIALSGDISADMDRLRAFFAGVVGIRPENASRICLREEDPEAPAS